MLRPIASHVSNAIWVNIVISVIGVVEVRWLWPEDRLIPVSAEAWNFDPAFRPYPTIDMVNVILRVSFWLLEEKCYSDFMNRDSRELNEAEMRTPGADRFVLVSL